MLLVEKSWSSRRFVEEFVG